MDAACESASPIKRERLATAATATVAPAQHDLERRSALARLFAAATDTAPPTSPLHVAVASRLLLDPDVRASRAAAVESPHRAVADSPLSWPRTLARKSNQTHSTAITTAALHMPSNARAFSPMPSPESVSSDFQQQQTQQKQRFFHSKALELSGPQSEAEAEPQDEVSKLREQNALLRKNLEYEQMRRMVDQKRMQEKIIELQGLIRRDFPEQQKAQERRLVQMRSPSAARAKMRANSKHSANPRLGLARRSSKSGDELSLSRKSSDEISLSRKSSKSSDEMSLSRKSSKSSDVGATSECEEAGGGSGNQSHAHSDDDEYGKPPALSPGVLTASLLGKAAKEDAKWTEVRMKKQLTKLRARMQAMVTDAHAETHLLRTQLQSERLAFERKERQLRVDTNAKLFALEERHASTKKRLNENIASLSSKVRQLRTENEMLMGQLTEKDARIRQLELAVSGKRIVESTAALLSRHDQQQQQQSPSPPQAQ